MPQHTLSELAGLCGAELIGDPALTVVGAASLAEASAREISFCADERFLGDLARTRAGAVVVPFRFRQAAGGRTLLVCADANRAFGLLADVFAAERPRPEPGIHPSALVHPSARVAPDASIGALCVIGREVEIAARAVLHPHVVVGERSRIGADTVLFPRVVLYEGVSIGERCLVHAGAVLGSDGFGYEPPERPGEPWKKIPQVGGLVVEDEVEIGAGCAIDRARFGTTRIGRGCKLDNLIHVAHNVVLGERCMLAAQVGIAGSTRLGEDCLLGGQVGVAGHVAIGARAKIAARSGVIGSLPEDADVMGYPAQPRKALLRDLVRLSRLERLIARVQRLERRAGLAQAEPPGAEPGAALEEERSR